MKRLIVLFILFVFPFFSYALDASRILEEMNNERVSLGLLPLAENRKLDLAAFNKATTLTFLKELKHTESLGGVPWSFIQDAGYLYDSAGENLAVNFETEGEVISHWMESSSHRANILRADFKEVGISIVDGSYQGGDAPYIVVYFAKPETNSYLPNETNRETQIKLLMELIKRLMDLLQALQAK